MSLAHSSFGQVKFIKFFAWEDRWIQKALDAREVEMKWMVKGMCAISCSVLNNADRCGSTDQLYLLWAFVESGAHHGLCAVFLRLRLEGQ